MNNPPLRVERRVTQRFPYLLPLSLRQVSPLVEGQGFTQDVSSRGVFFFTDIALQEGAEVEVTLRMPSEITLGEGMRVRARGHILRVVKRAAMPVATAQDSNSAPSEMKSEEKIGVAVRLEGYEYLSEMTESSASFARVSALHSHPEPVR
jgi:hypothetical protein